MSRYGLVIELDVDGPSVGDLGEAGFNWFEMLSEALSGDQRRDLEKHAKVQPGGATSRRGTRRRSGVSAGRPVPLGEPGTSWGSVSVVRWERGLQTGAADFSAESMRWLRTELVNPPQEARLEFGYLDTWGHRAGRSLNLWVIHHIEAPEWLRLGATIPEAEFVDPGTGAGVRRRWLDVVHQFADEANPGFGHISYGYSDLGTALEDALGGQVPYTSWDPKYTVGQCRQVLRGYSWLTVLPQELTARLGGPEKLRASGAFAEVTPLSAGGVWLLATADYRDFDKAAVARIFRVLAPVLLPGKPRQRPQLPGKPPHPIVFEDAARSTSPGSAPETRGTTG